MNDILNGDCYLCDLLILIDHVTFFPEVYYDKVNKSHNLKLILSFFLIIILSLFEIITSKHFVKKIEKMVSYEVLLC